ncbi:MAG: 3-phosphoserine/phosphohydroxythreonine transaminase [Clostridia bacterium]|nr:3-phosphoserine/phosphohydroxythreonine transaminase [Clostridia bacterium]MBQ9598670.1 3-phosphoserine/phosphohydroxythreonine transaminase [Clostridia bacterium]MBR0028326.1 3-phosphoserine/phosphohydroxythreonine transaminase [Clostridia bacterium]
MSRVYNFSAGPSMLPEEVLKKAQEEMVEYGTSGMSVMEMSHRSKDYQAIIDEAEALVRELMNVPDNYKVLFLQGGGSTQFAMIPLNLAKKNKKADYVITGQWAKKAAEQAEKYITVNRVASSADKTFSYIPKLDKSAFSDDADYFYICYNNTIYGTRYTSLPDTDKPLIADISSCAMSEVIDVSKFGLLFAGAQKNLGPAGVTLVIVREDLIGDAMDITPIMLNYKTHADNGSMYNTPPTYAIYVLKLVLEWIKSKGGIAELQKINEAKAKILYDFLDSSKLFKGTVVPEDRSLMNAPFVTGDEEMDAKFIAAAKEAGFVNLKGHRTVGGMRASIYNAMPVEGVEKLVAFMKKFEEENA